MTMDTSKLQLTLGAHIAQIFPKGPQGKVQVADKQGYKIKVYSPCYNTSLHKLSIAVCLNTGAMMSLLQMPTRSE